MIQKYGNVDTDDICMKLDAIKQEPRERVKNILSDWTNCSARARYQMWNRREDSWPDEGQKSASYVW
jgi:hypothetical protein